MRPQPGRGGSVLRAPSRLPLATPRTFRPQKGRVRSRLHYRRLLCVDSMAQKTLECDSTLGQTDVRTMRLSDRQPMERSASGVTPAQNGKRVEGRRRRAAQRCQCGQCPACEENARWERIFNEKFADPDYYSRPAV